MFTPQKDMKFEIVYNQERADYDFYAREIIRKQQGLYQISVVVINKEQNIT